MNLMPPLRYVMAINASHEGVGLDMPTVPHPNILGTQGMVGRDVNDVRASHHGLSKNDRASVTLAHGFYLGWSTGPASRAGASAPVEEVFNRCAR